MGGSEGMASKIERQKTGSTPYVLVDEGNNYMRFEGECYHENVIEFFREITKWLEEYLEKDFKHFTFDCELQYFNSSTAKLLLNILLSMDDHSMGENQVTVNWITTQDNDIIIECGEDFQEEMDSLEFNLIVK